MRLSALSVAIALCLSSAALADPLDTADRALRDAARTQAWTAPIGTVQAWANPVSGNSGAVRAIKEGGPQGKTCREVSESLISGGRSETNVVIGCRGADARWQVVQTAPAETATTENGVAPADLPVYQPPADISADPPHPSNQLDLPVPVGVEIRRPVNTSNAK